MQCLTLISKKRELAESGVVELVLQSISLMAPGGNDNNQLVVGKIAAIKLCNMLLKQRRKKLCKCKKGRNKLK